MVELNREVAQKVLAVVDAGLSSGLGNPIPGEMCIEAAVCYALGEPHGDRPSCVGSAVRAFKLRLNDSCWSSEAARAKGLRKLGVVQLGSDRIDQQIFATRVAELTICRIVPIALRVAARAYPAQANALKAAASECEETGSLESAHKARDAAYAVYAADAASAAAYAADAAAYAAAYAAYAADAAAAYAAAERDRTLAVSADLALEVLIELKSPGCAWLDLCEGA